MVPQYFYDIKVCRLIRNSGGVGNVEVENILKLTMRLTIGTVESRPAVLTVTSVSSRCVDAVGPIHTGIAQTLIDIYNVHYT